MRYRLTFMTGVAVGYVLGARAGRERYEQLRKAARQFVQAPAVQEAARKVKVVGGSAAGKMGDKLPDSVSERVRYLRERSDDGEWGTSGT